MVRVITGHICSGKSTHVTANARRGDIVIDCDRIASAISTDDTPSHQYTETANELARLARRTIVEAALTAHRRASYGRPDAPFDVWIVHAYPDENATRMYRRFDAVFTCIEADAATLLERASRERQPEAVTELRRRLG